jgi:hypothetical protein
LRPISPTTGAASSATARSGRTARAATSSCAFCPCSTTCDGRALRSTAQAATVRSALRGLDEVLSAAGVRESVKVGEPFDPATCEAIGEEPGDGVAPGHVTSVLQPGYRLGERVLRAALVRVASAGPEPAPADSEGGS